MPKVSVIIPNYNHERYLKQRIDSVLSQTYQDFEVIILDDKSTDNSNEVIELYRSRPKVSKIVYNEINSGSTFKQWNKGIRLAEGELIWLAESDDDASPFFLEEMVARFNQNSTLGIVYCDSYYMNEDSEKLQCTHIWKNERFATDRWSKDFFNIGIDEVNNFLIYHNVIDNASSALFKKQALFDAGLADESFRYAGDMHLYMKVLLLSNVAYISKPLNYFRDHLVNTSKESFKNGSKYLEILLCYSNIISNNKKIHEDTKKKRFKQALLDYRHFAFYSLKKSKNISLFLNAHFKLLKANSRNSIKLFATVAKTALIGD